MEKEAVLTEALALPERGRAEVAARLLESLGGPGIAMTDAEVLEEAKRRSEEMDEDPANTVTAVEKGRQDLKEGKTVAHEEVKDALAGWITG